MERMWSGLLATCSTAPAQDASAQAAGSAAKMDEDVTGGLCLSAGRGDVVGTRPDAERAVESACCC